jgi:hypothetical protein
METETVLVADVNPRMKEGWKLYGPPVLDDANQWRQTIIERYPDAYTNALMISTKKIKSMGDIEWLFNKIFDMFAHSLDNTLHEGQKEYEGDTNGPIFEVLFSNVGWPSFISKFNMERRSVLSIDVVPIFVVNPIMDAIGVGASLGQTSHAKVTFSVQYILLALRVFLKLSYLHLRDLQGLEIADVDVNGIQFSGVKFKYADTIMNRVENMAKINGLVFDGDIPSGVRDKVKNMFESVLGDNHPDLTRAMWKLLQYQ